MTRPLRHIGISLGQLKSFNDGLGEFSQQLCTRFAAAAPRLREEHGVQLWVHLNADLVGRFGAQVEYLTAEKGQRKLHRRPVHFDVWHSLHQLNRTLAPAGTAWRIVTVHDLNFLYFKNAFSRWRDMWRLRALARRTDEIVTISHYVQGDVRRHLQWQGPIEVIHNGVSDLSAAPRTPVDVPCRGGFLFHLSRMAPSKNVAAIVELAACWPEQHFVFAGPESDDSHAMQAQIQRRGLRNVSLFTSISNEQKAWLFANCQGLVFPSFTEGFGLPVVEAMYFGKPVFLSRLTSLPEVGGEVACYFDSFEPSAMRKVVSQGIAHAQQDPGLAGRLQAQAQSFQWDRCAERYLALYLRQLGVRRSD
jgi:glycosyltransferase involved in cell wall biosynthesis